MSALPHFEEHRVTAVARDLCSSLGDVADVPVWSMSALEAGDALVLLTRARSQLDALLVRVLAQSTAVGVGSDVGLTTPAWWAQETRVTRAEANRVSSLSSALQRYGDVAAALAAGSVQLDQARVIVDAVNRAKPSGAKGQYLKTLTVATTMGPGIRVDIPAVLAAAQA